MTTDIQADFIVGLHDMIDRAIVPLEDENTDVLGDGRAMYAPDGRYSPETLAIMQQARVTSAAAGYYTALAATELGGAGFGAVDRYLIWESLYRKYGGSRFLPYLTLPHWTSGPSFLLTEMRPAVREVVAARVLGGEATVCFAMSEPDAGSDAWSMSTRARRVDGGWVLSGTKQWISNATYAEYVYVFAVTDDGMRRDRKGGITCFLVPTDTPGFAIDSVIKMMGSIGGKEAIVSLNDVFVPDDHLVGAVDNGFVLAMQGVSDGRMYNAGRAVGLAQWAIAMATEYAKTRQAFGKPIADYQAVSGLLADSAIDTYAGRSVALRCGRSLDDGENAVRDLAIVIAFTTEMCFRVVDRCMQVHGAIGFTNELGLYDAWHQARLARVADGTGEIMRKTIAARLFRGELDF